MSYQNRLLAAPHAASGGLKVFIARLTAGWTALQLFMIALVAVPTTLALLYFGIYASKRYESESVFVVRSVSSNRLSGLAMFFQSFGISRAADDTHAVENYMLSRDALRELETLLPMRKIFAREGVDIFATFPYVWSGNSFERFYDYYLDRVSVVQDMTTGLTTLRVIAFKPEDSQAIARALLQLAEKLVNSMNERAQADTVRSATNELSLAEARVLSAQRDLAEFRNKALLIDPKLNSESALQIITALSTEAARAKAAVSDIEATAASSPALRGAKEHVESLQQRISDERAMLAGQKGALSDKIGDFDRLELSYDLAQKNLASSYSSLELARQEARRQQIYVETVVAPNLADGSTEPQRLRAIATVFICSFMVAAVIWILRAGTTEHAH